jgi:hypothetical protein
VTQRTASIGEILTFSDAEPLRALEAITKRRPKVVAFERLFAITPRGAALINRIKADPKLKEAEIRVLAHDSDYARVVPRPVAAPPPALDQRGTRRAPRYKIKARTAVTIDAKGAQLVDLSIVGAHVVSSSALKPNQVVTMVLSDAHGSIRFNAKVVWTSFEIPPDSGPRYRAGIDFTDADPVDVDAYCSRHRG